VNLRALASAGTVLLMLALVPLAASAGTISISLATRVTPAATAVRVELDLRNGGDEAARDLTPTIEFQGRIVAGSALATLDPASSQTVSFDVPLAGTVPPRGGWPVLVRVRYTDAGGYPFEAIHVDLARFGEVSAAPDVRLTVPDARVETETTIQARIDRGAFDGPIRLGFATPAGVIVTPRIVTLEPDADATVPLTVAVAGATLTSRLPLVTMAEFDTVDGHHTVTAVSTIEIGPSGSGTRTRVAVLAILVLSALAVWAIVTRLARRRGVDL
jgi:hypothetical protein